MHWTAEGHRVTDPAISQLGYEGEIMLICILDFFSKIMRRPRPW